MVYGCIQGAVETLQVILLSLKRSDEALGVKEELPFDENG